MEFIFAKPSETSKIKGYVAVNINGQYFGKVNKEGEFYGNPNIEKYSQVISNINNDLLHHVKETAKKTGHCCFCNLELTSEDSVLNGYGETCAKHYNLPYETSESMNSEFNIGDYVKYVGKSKKIESGMVKVVKINKTTCTVLDVNGEIASVSQKMLIIV